MDECEDLIIEVAQALGHSGSTITLKGAKISLEKPWERLSVADAFSRYGSVSIEQALEQNMFDEVLCRDIEPELGKRILPWPSDLRFILQVWNLPTVFPN
jgi:lysyl-tRNA synthetase class 2